MSDERWIAVRDCLPPDDVVVQTKIDDAKDCRNEQPLVRQGRLWFFPSYEMYVYYTPTHWAALSSDGEARTP